MTQKLVIGPFNRGLRNDIPPFYIDNDSFPELVNAYQWRGRAKRKRGTEFICRLERFFNSLSTVYNPGTTTQILNGSGAGNLFTGFTNLLAISPNASINPGHVVINDITNGQTYTDLNLDGTLQGSGGGTGTINYATGAFTITGGAANIVNANFNYFPGLPAMDIEDLNLVATQFPETLAFDTVYSYQIVNAFPYYAYDVSFYKNPPVDATNLPGYVRKTSPTPLRWHGENYQQFWSVSYEGAEWATNGIAIPFNSGTSVVGMQFRNIEDITNVVVGPPAFARLKITNHGLVVGDFLFINEVQGSIAPYINFQTGYVTVVVDADHVTVEFPFATFSASGYTANTGIAQYLTSSAAAPTKDPIRWYDGDPTNGTEFNPTFSSTGKGWVNFSPPLANAVGQLEPLGGLPTNVVYYLVGARMIVPYKDRLLFLGPVVQSSTTGPFYLQDTVVFSQNGTPYYTASFTATSTASVVSAATVYHPILVPTNFTGTPNAYFVDVAGFGGFITAGYAQPITTVGSNQDTLIVGFTTRQTKLLYTGNDLVPFNFYIINSEIGSTATFSTITLDRGILSIGDRGISITDQQSNARIDLEIPDQVFEFDLLNNGTERITATRDFINEWAYFTYPFESSEDESVPFPNQTLFYNYRNNSWAIFNESYTTYGPFRRQTGYTWATVGGYYPSWNAWNNSWDEASSSLLEQEVIAGNQQGFIISRRGDTTAESPSLFITAITGNTITSPNHGLNTGDFIYISGAIGGGNLNSPQTATITGVTNANPAVITANNSYIAGQQILISGVVGMTEINSGPFTITSATSTTISIDIDSTNFGSYISGGTTTTYNIWQITVVDVDSFMISNPIITPAPGTYLGNGTIIRLYVPFIESKQFPMAWDLGRKTRIGAQQYLFTTTAAAQVTLNLFLSQNGGTPFNLPPYVPNPNAQNNSVVFSNILYTCQESTNLGLTPANINLQQLVPDQQQTWHRMNTSLIGDTVQFGITISDEQMFDATLTNQIAEVEFHGCVISVSPSQVLA